MADWYPSTVPPIASDEELAAAEAELGFALPDLLRDLYTTIVNGGFGPGLGLFGVESGAGMFVGNDKFTAVEAYRSFRCRYHPRYMWPRQWLPVCHWGCSIYSCLDCTTSQMPVLALDTNRKGDGPWGCDCKPHAKSLAEWLRRWLDGEDLWKSLPLTGEPKFGFEKD